jgi:hypothetical protein
MTPLPIVARGGTTLQLIGIEADNLLAFFALLGLLRVLDFAKPEWCAHAAWSGTPMTAQLSLAAMVDPGEVLATADAAIRQLGRTYTFDRDDLTYKPDEFRHLAVGAWADRERARLGAPRRDGETIEPTPLCAMFGQGHQHFLFRLAADLDVDTMVSEISSLDSLRQRVGRLDRLGCRRHYLREADASSRVSGSCRRRHRTRRGSDHRSGQFMGDRS